MHMMCILEIHAKTNGKQLMKDTRINILYVIIIINIIGISIHIHCHVKLEVAFTKEKQHHLYCALLL